MQRRNAGQSKGGGDKGPRTPDYINKVSLSPRLKNIFFKMLEDFAAINEAHSPAGNEPQAVSADKKVSIKERLAGRYKIQQEKPMPALARIPAEFHQIAFSLYVHSLHSDEVLSIFSEKFGRPMPVRNRFWHHFRNGLKLSRSNTQFYHSLRFSNLSLLNELKPLQEIFQDRQMPGKYPSPALQLSIAEVKFDYHLPQLSYEEAKSILQELVLFLLPQKNNYAELIKWHGSKFKKVGNETYNGNLLFYFGNIHKLPADEQQEEDDNEISPWQQKPKSRWRGKAYLKSFDNQESWHIRIEATLKGDALRKIGGKRLPENLIDLEKRLAGLCFKDFWKMEIFDREAFLNEAMPIFEASRGASRNMGRRIILKLINLEENQYVIRQKGLARRLAKLLDSKSLQRQIDKGKFSIPMAVIDVLSKNSSSK